MFSSTVIDSLVISNVGSIAEGSVTPMMTSAAELNPPVSVAVTRSLYLPKVICLVVMRDCVV